MSSRRLRERNLPSADEVWADDEADPGRFFGGRGRSRHAERKGLQLCRQVERAAALTLADECESDALAGACVASVQPAPDAARLRVTVVLAPGRGIADIEAAASALRRRGPAFREEVARAIHRKRAPEIVFDVKVTSEGERESGE